MNKKFSLFQNLLSGKVDKIQEGSSYAVLKGDYYGEIFVLIEQKDDNLFFVSIPNMKVRKVESNKFEFGLKNKILDFIEIVPKEPYRLLKEHAKNMIRDKKFE
jgi:hypothetical protein